MTIHAFPTPALLPTVEAARDLVAQGARAPLAGWTDAEVAEGIAGLSLLESQVEAWRLAVAEADARALAEQEAAAGTDAWLATLTGSTREVAAGGLWIARLLQEKYAATRDAFAAGRLRVDQVPRGTGEGTRDGRPLDARRLRQAARRMCVPISRELALEHQQALLGREQRRAEAETWLTLGDNGDGTFSGRFVIPELHGRLLRRRLDTLCAPRRLSCDRAGEPVVDPTLPGSGPGLSRSEHLGLAFTELLEHLPCDGHAANGATLIVTLELDALLDGLGAARLETGDHITAGEAWRLACNAGLVPAVLGTRSEPLDLARAARLHTRAQRQALSLRHDSCSVAGCQRPYSWCEIHHPRPWSRGWRTDLANALPLCFFHHRRAHDDQFDLHRSPSGDRRFHRRT